MARPFDLVGSVLGLAFVASLGCSSEDPPKLTQGDAGGSAATDAGPSDAGASAPPDAGGPCEGACKTTGITATLGAGSAPLDRAQHGTETGSGGAPLLYVEAHAGGDPACPGQNSPSPDRTFILANVPRGKAGDVFTKADGVTAAFLDFEGSLELPPTTSASSVTVTLVDVDDAEPPAFVALDVTATFAEGTVTGHAYTSYCASLSR